MTIKNEDHGDKHVKELIGCALGLVTLMIQTPIWYLLVYKILIRVDATPIMWVFYWIYLPVGVVLAALRVLSDGLVAKRK